MPKINPRQIIIAREARGWTQSDLIKKVPKLGQGNLSKLERGLLTPTESTMEEIATVLNFPLSFFYAEESRPPLSNLYYRKKYKVTGKVLKTLRAKISIITAAIGRLLDEVEMEKKFERIRFDLTTASWTPESAALAARKILGIPPGPIQNLISYVEKSGIMVYYTNFDVEGFDGVAAFTDSGYPILFVNGNRSNDRIRMNIAHEKGHVALHIPFVVEPYRDEEYETRIYAGEFLMPSHEIRNDLKNLTYDRLTDLKEYWNVSKAALIEKARSLGTINHGTYIYLRTELSRRNERINETGFVELDKPTLLQKIINLYKDNLGYTDNDLADLMNLSFEDFKSFFQSDDGQVRFKKLVPVI